MKKFASYLFILTLMTAVITLHAPVVSAIGSISLTPVNSSILEGQSQMLGIHLASNPGSSVTLTFSSSNPDTVSFSPSSITYLASEWAQTKNFTVSAPANGTYGDSRNVIIMAKASSASQEYNGLAGGANIQVTDTTDVPGTSDPQDPPNPQDPVEEEDPTSETEEPEATKTTTQKTQQQSDLSTQSYLDPSQQDLESPDDISLFQAMGSPSESLDWFKDGLLPSKASSGHKALAYTIFLMFMTLGIGLIILYERKYWWIRQENKVLKWQYRHPSPKQSRKRSVSKKK